MMAALIGAAFETGDRGPIESAEAIVSGVVVGLDHLADECAPSFDSIIAALFMSGRLAGNRGDYGDPSNSYLHRVLETGLGIPITLSACAMEVGRRLDVPIEGIGLPGHFLIRCDGEYADPFHGGRRYSTDELEPAWQRITGTTGDLERRFVQPTHTRSILLRMLNNLKNILVAMDEPGPLSVLAALRGAFPELAHERAEHARWMRHWN